MTQGSAELAKQQRSTQLPGDLLRLTEQYEKTSGAKLNRQVLAGLLRFFFGRLRFTVHYHPDIGIGPFGPHDPFWMRLAVQVDRGELAVADLPFEILDASITSCEKYIVDLTAGNVSRHRWLHHEHELAAAQCWREEAKSWRQGLINDVEDFGGRLEAILEGLTFPGSAE